MGNRLFQYHFMKQLAYNFEEECFYPKIADSVWFEDMEENKIKWSIFKNKEYFSNKKILDLGKKNFLINLKNCFENKKYIVLEPGILGDHFFEYLFADPSNIIKIKEKYKISKFEENSNLNNIAIHFRGTDFEEWNKDAILDFEYYRNSIDYCLESLTSDIEFYIFTDDVNLDAYLQTVEYMKESNLNFHLGDTDKEAIYDFSIMSECDVVISSPSTFSIWAGILGKQKKIIHSQKWIENRVQNNDKFWIDLTKSTNPIYKLWRTF